MSPEQHGAAVEAEAHSDAEPSATVLEFSTNTEGDRPEEVTGTSNAALASSATLPCTPTTQEATDAMSGEVRARNEIAMKSRDSESTKRESPNPRRRAVAPWVPVLLILLTCCPLLSAGGGRTRGHYIPFLNGHLPMARAWLGPFYESLGSSQPQLVDVTWWTPEEPLQCLHESIQPSTTHHLSAGGSLGRAVVLAGKASQRVAEARGQASSSVWLVEGCGMDVPHPGPRCPPLRLERWMRGGRPPPPSG